MNEINIIVDPQHQTTFKTENVIENENIGYINNSSQDTNVASEIYFCFEDKDNPESPNKLIIAKSDPTVADLCSTLKIYFFPLHDVTLSCTFMQGSVIGNTEFPQDSEVSVPINDRSNVVVLKSRYTFNGCKWNPQTIQILHWLQGNNLDSPEIVSIFLRNRITLDNMKYLKETDLINLGAKEWGIRIAILEAISKYYTLLPSVIMDGQTSIRQTIIEQTNQTNNQLSQETTNKRGLESKPFVSNKRPKLSSTPNKKRIRFKDLDVLVNDPLIPVDIDSIVTCEGSDCRGSVVLNKQKKPVIEFITNTTKRTGTIAQYYKFATGEPLQAKGDSWSKIFFTDVQTNVIRSLADLKYLIKGPKKAVSAFLYFSKGIRGTLPKTVDFAKKSGDKWKALSYSEKLPYKVKEQEDKERFAKEKAMWTMLTQQLQQQRGLTDLGDSLIGEVDI